LLVIPTVGTSSRSRSVVALSFDISTSPSRAVEGGEKFIEDRRWGTTPTLLPEEEYIVPSGVVSESFRKALARTAKLQTKSDIQNCVARKEERKW
jgi:hypothetical protein